MEYRRFENESVRIVRTIHTPSHFAKNRLLYLQEIGITEVLRPHVGRRESLPSFLFFAVTKGAGQLEYDGRRFGMRAGDCAFLDCAKPYAHRSARDLWEIRWIHFYGKDASDLFEKYLESGGKIVFAPPSPEPFFEVFERLFLLSASSDHVREMKANAELARLHALAAEACRTGETRRGAGAEDRPERVKAEIEERFAEKITLDSLAKRHFVSKHHLARTFKARHGMSVMEYLLRVRITRAKELLRFSEMTVEQIAAECGMPDANYFGRMFKKTEGVSPGDYRKRWRSGGKSR